MKRGELIQLERYICPLCILMKQHDGYSASLETTPLTQMYSNEVYSLENILQLVSWCVVAASYLRGCIKIVS